jgi:hypothetical protein
MNTVYVGLQLYLCPEVRILATLLECIKYLSGALGTAAGSAAKCQHHALQDQVQLEDFMNRFRTKHGYVL